MERTIEGTVPSATFVQTDVLDEGAQALPQDQQAPILHLRLEHHPRTDRRVGFHEGVVDNEHMNRKKSKCCCIYRKPLAFGESSSDDDDECEHCFGHPEVRKKNRKHHKHEHEGDGCQLASPPPGDASSGSVSASEPTAMLQASEATPPAEQPAPDNYGLPEKHNPDVTPL